MGQNARSYDPTEDIFRSFANGCSSVGDYTRMALAQSQTLQQIIESMKNQPACRSLQGALAGVASITDLTAQTFNNTNQDFKKSQLEGEISRLVVAYGQESDAVSQRSYADAIAKKRMELFALEERIKSKSKSTALESAGIYQHYATAAINQLQNDSECFGANSNGKAAVASHLISLSSRWLSFPLGLAAFTIGNTLNSVLAFVTNKRFVDLKNNLRNSTVGIGTLCAIESITKTYCSARDAETVLRAQDTLKTSDKEGDSASWRGLIVLERDLSYFDEWILRAIAGAPANNSEGAGTKIKGDLLISNYYMIETTFQALISQARSRLLGASDSEKIIIIRGLISDLADSMSEVASVGGGRSGSLDQRSPFYPAFLGDLTCGRKHYLITGEKVAPQTNNLRCPEYPDAKIPKFEDVVIRIDSLKKETFQLISREANFYRENNPKSVLALAEGGNGMGPNVKEALKITLDYLNGLKPNENYPETRANIEDLTKTLKEALKIFDKKIAEFAEKDAEFDKLSALVDKLAPKRDGSYLRNALRTIVRWDIRDRMFNKMTTPDVNTILELSVTDAVDTIKNGNMVSTAGVQADIGQAQELSKVNLETLGTLLEKPIVDRLVALSNTLVEDEKGFKDVPKVLAPKVLDGIPSAMQFNLAKSCVQLLALPNTVLRKLDKKISAICKDQRIIHYVNGKPSDLKILFEAVSAKSQRDRYCQWYDYDRKVQLLNLSK